MTVLVFVLQDLVALTAPKLICVTTPVRITEFVQMAFANALPAGLEAIVHKQKLESQQQDALAIALIMECVLMGRVFVTLDTMAQHVKRLTTAAPRYIAITMDDANLESASVTLGSAVTFVRSNRSA